MPKCGVADTGAPGPQRLPHSNCPPITRRGRVVHEAGQICSPIHSPQRRRRPGPHPDSGPNGNTTVRSPGSVHEPLRNHESALPRILSYIHCALSFYPDATTDRRTSRPSPPPRRLAPTLPRGASAASHGNTTLTAASIMNHTTDTRRDAVSIVPRRTPCPARRL